MIGKVFSKFPRTFWVANTIELFERWAYYGFYMLFAVYLTGSIDQGGLELSSEQKGNIMGNGTAFLYFLPILTGAIADKLGYKKMLFVSFIIYITAFLAFPMFKTYEGVFVVFIALAIGAGLFKPIISATIAKTTSEETSSVGFGIFYMMVNIGAFFGPLTSLYLKGDSYNIVFYISALFIAINFVLLFFYKEPERQKNTDSFSKIFTTVAKNIVQVFLDWRFVVFIFIIAGFWAMYYQLFFTLPVFIEQWVDSSSMFNFFKTNIPFIADNFGRHGQMDPEFLTNFDALYIIIFQIPISLMIMKIKPLKTITIGILVSSFGMALTLITQNWVFFLSSLFVFGVGEMIGSPKITEYIGSVAPREKKALYMGYSFVPVFFGSLLAGKISGSGYAWLADKNVFLQDYIVHNGLKIDETLPFNQKFAAVSEAMGLTQDQLTNFLWFIYKPYHIWILIFGIGLTAAFGLFLFNKFIIKHKP